MNTEKHTWILQVISDLRTYAEIEGFTKLQEMLVDAEFIAVSEILAEAKNGTETTNITYPSIFGH